MADRPDAPDRPTPVALAVDIGGTKVEAGLVDAGGVVRPASVHRRPTGRTSDRQAIGSAIVGAAAEALAHLAPGETVIGIGIGSAGPVDRPAGTISPVNLPSAQGLAVRDALAALVPGVPVELALDGACLALAEQWRGAIGASRNALAMVVSTGVGGGLIIDGRLATGVSGNAGHLGQMRLRAPEAEPGRELAGTLEDLASGPASVAWSQAQGWTGTTGEELARSYRAGEQVAVSAVRRSASAVGEALASVGALLDLELAVVAGGFTRVADDYLDLVQAAVHRWAPLPYVGRLRVVPSPLGRDTHLIGAAALVLGG